ncbi:MAG: carboxypeptidase M32 [Planctomycetales bacterium]|nr:carboxypeptidase M32 [Planctomycetales bacterium]
MSTLQSIKEHLAETARYESILSLLHWDQQTYIPAKAHDYRAEQVTTLSGLIHRRSTDPKLGEWLDEAAEIGDDSIQVAAVIRHAKRDFDRATKLPAELVEELARCTSKAHQVWVESRAANDFAIFQPMLEQVVSLKQQQADAIGFDECRYDALLDEFEPDMRTSEVCPLLERLRSELVPLVNAIMDSGKTAPANILERTYPVDAQARFGKEAAAAIGFDFQRGRIDVTHHPFCTELGPHDCRILTRYDEKFFSSAFFGTLHEAGHGMYQQGLPADWYGTGPGKYVSLGVHESQSRLWENQVGRSRAFWQHFFSIANSYFPTALDGVSLDDWYWAVNDVRPSLIRVEADEATYNLHIIVRFEIEQELIDGSLAACDAPDAWNARYEKYLGITPDSDANGILQDVHWSEGLFGYFPTYSLGNLYSAQLFEKANEELGSLEEQFSAGEFTPLLKWLQDNVHGKGSCYSAKELVERATGTALSHDALMRHLADKLNPLYRID